MSICAPMYYSNGQSEVAYKQKYSQTLYLAVCSENVVGGILNWRISLLYGEKPILVVYK